MKILILLSLVLIVSCGKDGPSTHTPLNSVFFGAFSAIETNGNSSTVTISATDIVIDTTISGVTTSKTYPFVSWTDSSAMVTTPSGAQIWEIQISDNKHTIRICTPTGLSYPMPSFDCKYYSN